ncbi:aminoglycoside phosphotransferase family protein [Zhihengliuella halotolerans]|uniref:Phosphotransferase family enzyme n=1 Tax=Zhihengliuella halotolerans TaxID=370736 RepID=A0A4Q8AHE7_9MICC|nr:aminoglycoside phosphotransferase family protein [Zhihengliuella halotolerans]RZU63205.1 phosphotransferase family enzyme [Zhihengliuella halotolerans]
MDDDLDILNQANYRGARLLAKGMEGSVYLLHDGTVGKVPHSSGPSAAQDDGFGTALATRSFPFAVPAPLGTTDLSDGRTMRIERLLPGRPLDDFYDPTLGALNSHVVTAVGDVLAGLRELQFEVPARTILDGERYDATVDTWADTLVSLGHRRFAKFGKQLRARDPDVRRTVSDLLTFLASRRDIEPRVIHGDICGANVLVDDDCHVTAVIDWGFFSVLAEPELDAAIASAVLDMYGPHAADIEGELTDALVERFDLNRDALVAYKGVYALMTSNVYSPDGTDGHFAWCSAILARPDVQAAAATFAERAEIRVEAL